MAEKQNTIIITKTGISISDALYLATIIKSQKKGTGDFTTEIKRTETYKSILWIP